MSKKLRPGFHRFPRWLYQASGLTTDQRFLLMYFDSHDAAKWVFNADDVAADMGWGRKKYFKVARELEDAGLIVRTTFYELDAATRKKVPAGCKVDVKLPDLSSLLRDSESGPESPKSPFPKWGLIRREYSEGRSDPSVIDDGDVG